MILASLSESVTGEDKERLGALLRAVDRGQLDLDTIDVGGLFAQVMSMHPDDAATLLRANFGTLEARLAS